MSALDFIPPAYSLSAIRWGSGTIRRFAPDRTRSVASAWPPERIPRRTSALRVIEVARASSGGCP